MSKEENNKYIYTPLPEPIPITEQEWPDDVLPLVSIRTMAYNHEKFIRECIEGVLIQKTTFPVQFLIHDDASTDNTASIIREYEEKYPRLIKAYYQEENSYSKRPEEKAKLRKTFFQWRKGKYQALCEGDDYWIDPLKLQKQAEILEENENVGIVHTGFIKYDMINDTKEPQSVDVKGDPLQYYLTSWQMKTATVMLRSKLLPLITKIKKNPIIRKAPHGDRVAFLTLAVNSDIVYLNDFTSVYRIFPGESATRYKSPQKRFEIRSKMNRIDYELMKDLGIKNKSYKTKVIYRIVTYKLISQALKVKIFLKIFKFLYHNLGYGTYKNSRYY